MFVLISFNSAGLQNLEILHAARNGFNSSIFSSLEQLSSLNFLDLSENDIEGIVQANGMFATYQFPIYFVPFSML